MAHRWLLLLCAVCGGVDASLCPTTTHSEHTACCTRHPRSQGCKASPERVDDLPASHRALARHEVLCRTVRTVEKGVGSTDGLLPFDHRILLTEGDVYQFGVFRGGSLSKLIGIYDQSSVWGFDTFQGLPPEQSGEATISSWKQGTFDVGGEEGAARIARSTGLK